MSSQIAQGVAFLIVFLSLQPTQSWTKREPKHGKTIIAYYASWQWYDRGGLAEPLNIDMQKVTRLNFAFFQTNVDGKIWGTDPWADPITLFGEFDWSVAPGEGKEYCSWDDPHEPPSCAGHHYESGLIHLAHQAGTEIYPSIGGWTLSDPFPVMAATPSARTAFAQNCAQLIKDYDFDGIDIDWEYPGYQPHSGTPEDTKNYSLLLREIRKALDELGGDTGRFYGLTAALPCGPDLIKNIEVDVVADIMTEMNLMTYDFHGSWNDQTGVNAPLYDQEGSPEFSVHGCVQNWLNGGGRHDQINIGLPFYGRSFQGKGITGLYQPHAGASDLATWSDDEGTPQYFNIVAKIGGFTSVRDQKTMTQYAYNDGGFVSYDDERAICDKTEYAINHKLNGFIIWEISGDLLSDLSTPLLDATNNKLDDPKLPCEAIQSVSGNTRAANPSNNVVVNPWYPLRTSSICINDGKQPSWLGRDMQFTSAEECCKALFPWNSVCTETAIDGNSNGSWYPMSGGCVSYRNRPVWISEEDIHDTKEDCCKAHFDFMGDCVSGVSSPNMVSFVVPPVPAKKPTPPTRPPSDVPTRRPQPEPPIYGGKDRFYPYFGAVGRLAECRNDNNAPEWMTEDMMKSSLDDCCSSYFFSWWSEQCRSAYASSKNVFYPNFGDISCVDDGNPPGWMAGDYFQDTRWLCCHTFFPGSLDLLNQCMDT